MKVIKVWTELSISDAMHELMCILLINFVNVNSTVNICHIHYLLHVKLKAMSTEHWLRAATGKICIKFVRKKSRLSFLSRLFGGSSVRVITKLAHDSRSICSLTIRNEIYSYLQKEIESEIKKKKKEWS